MQNQIPNINVNQFRKESQFDLSQALLDVAKIIDQNSQQQLNLYKKLITDLNMNGRQKLKTYKKILECPEKENMESEKYFINKYLKKVFLQQYLIGNTEGKLVLVNLLKKLQQISYSDLIEASKDITIIEFQEIKNWSQIVDLINREFKQTIGKEQFLSVRKILQILNGLVLQGCLLIQKDEFKTKWLLTFTQILRTENLLIRVFNQFVSEQIKNVFVSSCHSTLQRAGSLSKEVISQVYLLLVFLNSEEPEPSPQNQVCLIHYFHAQSVVKGTNNLKQLISLIPKLKQTEHKCHLLPILQKSFIQHYAKLASEEHKEFRNNVFDQVINLFEIGRSIYGYLQIIVKIIIEAGDHWNIEGNFLRKFFTATIVLKLLPTNLIIKQWPTIIEDVITQSGNMGIPYALDCAKILFEKLYEENDKNYYKWSALWIDSYKAKLLESNERGSIRGIIEFINPILLKVCSKPLLLKQLLILSDTESNSNLQVGIISLIRCYKQIGQIEVNEKDQIFQHALDKNISFSFNKIRNFLLSNDEMIGFQALELVSCSLKPSEEIKPMQLRLCLQFFKNATKTSMPEYRKNYLQVTKKLFERLRNIYENHLTAFTGDKKAAKKIYYSQFVDFLKKLVKICFNSVFSDVIFELVNPALEILYLLQTYFGNRHIQVKKGIFLEPTSVLKQTSFYEFTNFQNLLSCLQSSYQSVRKLAHDLLNYFNELQKKELLLLLWQKSLQNTNKLPIRSYEYACRVLTYISQVYPDILNVETKYESIQLNILNYFLVLTRQRYVIFKDQFIKQGSNYYKNLIHGLLTIFSYQIDKLAVNMANPDLYKERYSSLAKELKQFLSEFFTEIINMMNFAVEISSSNVSTVVLDTIVQGSQTDKKLKVDCRGHFLNETAQKGSSIGTLLQSTALISSMQDDEEGIQNTLVVSFYLLTRQAGLVFQSIGGLLSNKNSNDYIPSESLIKLINTYFYALINLKHMGSVDRISKGLGKMAMVIFDHQSKQLSQLPENLLNKLLNHLKSGNFTNILRRSAGVPFAFCCLLKSQSLKRNRLVQKSVTELLTLSRENNQNPIELRIHALNILKKLFQDSDLKIDMDPYVSEAFISSIKGFTSEEWGVRNSSLMLFTVLSNRTVGVKPTFNLLQFFLKCPNLWEFIQNELNNFTEASLNSMYPPLYPIVLLFSRLLPFDLKQRSKVPAQGAKHIRKQELLSLLPILDKAGLNHNYMGRVMTAKAILPFMQIDEINDYCVTGIQKLSEHFNKENNMLHYQLTKYYHLLTSHKEICKNSMRSIQISEQTLSKFWKFMENHVESIAHLNCPVVVQCFIKIFHYFFQTFNSQIIQQFGQKYFEVVQKICLMLHKLTKQYVFGTQRLIMISDLGHSMMRKEVVAFQLDLLTKYTNRFESFKNLAVEFTEFLSIKLQQNENFFQSSDNEICEFYLQKILQNMKSLKEEQKYQLFKSLNHMLQKLQLDKIRSDIIISKVLELRWSIGFKSKRMADECVFLLNLEKESNNHFLQIAIFKYLDYIKFDSEELLKLLFKFSDPNSLEELRQCVVEYIETLSEFDSKLNVIYIRLLEDEEYEIRKESARIVSKHLKIYHFNETVIKNEILAKLQLRDISLLLSQNSDFKIKRKNQQEERIFSYDKPNKFRSDITTLFDVLLTNDSILYSLEELSKIFQNSLNQSERKINVIEIYQKDIIQRNEYQLELILRQFLSKLNSPENNLQNQIKISKFHPLFANLINRLQSFKTNG